MTTSHTIIILLLSFHVISIQSELIPHFPCDSETDITIDGTSLQSNKSPEPWNCDIKEVRVSPCPETAMDRNERCNIRRGTVMQIDFDYTPDYRNHTSKNEIHGVGSNRGYFSWFNWFHFNQDTVGTYSFNVTIDKSTLPRPYDIKWRLENQHQQNCCFIIKINVRK
uniref:CSON008955 protein n=1 Tax=Culicoides sonorensis TaxID=179676 RepID=A0A336LE05_CULSO